MATADKDVVTRMAVGGHEVAARAETIETAEKIMFWVPTLLVVCVGMGIMRSVDAERKSTHFAVDGQWLAMCAASLCCLGWAGLRVGQGRPPSKIVAQGDDAPVTGRAKGTARNKKTK